jgi:hypothetical protein
LTFCFQVNVDWRKRACFPAGQTSPLSQEWTRKFELPVLLRQGMIVASEIVAVIRQRGVKGYGVRHIEAIAFFRHGVSNRRFRSWIVSFE